MIWPLSKFFSPLIDREVVQKYKLKEIKQHLERQESITTLWLPGGDRTSFAMHLQENSFRAKFMSKSLTAKLVMVYVNMKTDPKALGDYLNGAFTKYSDEKELMAKLIDITQKQKKKVYFVVDNTRKGNLENFEQLNMLRSANTRNINYLYVIKEKHFWKLKTKKPKHTPTSLFHNLVIVPYLNEKESMIYLNRTAKKLRIKVGGKDKKEIYNMCGGSPVLLKNILRQFNTYRNIKEIKKSLETQSLFQSHWKKFGKKEREVLANAFLQRPLPNYPMTIAYLKKHRLLRKDNTFSEGWMKYINL